MLHLEISAMRSEAAAEQKLAKARETALAEHERVGRDCKQENVERACTGDADGLPLISQGAARAQQARRRAST